MSAHQRRCPCSRCLAERQLHARHYLAHLAAQPGTPAPTRAAIYLGEAMRAAWERVRFVVEVREPGRRREGRR